MPTGPDLNTPCYLCQRPLLAHDVDQAKICSDGLSELWHHNLTHMKDKLFSLYLCLLQPDRMTSGRHCRVCYSNLPGEWGDGPAFPPDPEQPDARMCGACLRDISHDCHANARRAGDSVICGVCLRPISVDEFIPNLNERRSNLDRSLSPTDIGRLLDH